MNAQTAWDVEQVLLSVDRVVVRPLPGRLRPLYRLMVESGLDDPFGSTERPQMLA
jgi:hypothetical protein